MARQSGIFQIGYIQIRKENEGIGKIPFEFNPSIQETGITARYQSISILSRYGNLQAYTGSDSLSVNLDTEYFATAKDNNDSGAKELDGWMSGFTLVDLQRYELMYRSLVVPNYKEERYSANQGFLYEKPPLIKIIIGEPNIINVSNTPYANILTYPFGEGNFRSYRTFICTSVSINKNLNDRPLYLKEGEGNYLVDSFAFRVNLNLIETTARHSDLLPSFDSYKKLFRN